MSVLASSFKVSLVAVVGLTAYLTSLPSTPAAAPVQDAGPVWSARIMGPARGQIEPCGCSGGQLGGVDRVATALAMAPASGLPVGPKFAAGGVVSLEARPYAPWAAAQLEVFWQTFDALDFDAIGVGEAELDQLARFSEVRTLLGDTELVATNLQFETPIAGQPARLARVDGVVMLSFLPAQLSGAIETAAPANTTPDAESTVNHWQTLPPAAALKALETEGLWNRAEPTLAFFEGDKAAAREFSTLLGESSFVLRVADEMEASSTTPPGTGILEVGSRLRQVLRLSGGVLNNERVRETRVSENIPGDVSVQYLVSTYRSWLEYYDARGSVADSLPSQGTYAGDTTCMACHQSQHAIWKDSKHSHAWATLQNDLRDGVAATVDPRCVRCHTSGFGHKDGFGSAALDEATRWSEASPLVNVSCETCHGPGAEHARTASKAAIERGGEYTCLRCHDAENDPGFRYTERWAQINHLNGTR